MAILAVDEVMLREPRLLVPQMVPVGQVKLANTGIATKVTHAVLAGRFLYFRHGIAGKTTVVDVSAGGSIIGLVAASAAASGDYQSTPAFERRRSNGISLGIYAKPIAVGTRQDVYSQTGPASAYTQYTLAFNSNGVGGAATSLVAAWHYSSGFHERVNSTAYAIDGNWHVFIASLYQDGTRAPLMYRDGVNVTNDSTASSTVVSAGAFDILLGSGTTDPIALAVTFSPALTAAEASDWSRDPFSIFDPA